MRQYTYLAHLRRDPLNKCEMVSDRISHYTNNRDLRIVEHRRGVVVARATPLIVDIVGTKVFDLSNRNHERMSSNSPKSDARMYYIQKNVFTNKQYK